MIRLSIIICEYIAAGVYCEIVSIEMFHESVHYFVLALLIFVVRWITSKIEKKIEMLKNKDNEKL